MQESKECIQLRGVQVSADLSPLSVGRVQLTFSEGVTSFLLLCSSARPLGLRGRGGEGRHGNRWAVQADSEAATPSSPRTAPEDEKHERIMSQTVEVTQK